MSSPEIRTPEDEARLGALALEAYQLAREVSDDLSEFDITQCARKVTTAGQDWYDTTILVDPNEWAPTEQEMRERLERAARYLQARGRAERHPAFPHLVRLLPQEPRS